MVAALLDRLGVNPALYQQGTQPVYTPIDGSQIGAVHWEGAADKDAGHVQRIQAATALGIQGIHRPLAEDHVHLHAEIQDHAGHRETDDAVGRMHQARKKTQGRESCICSRTRPR